MPSVLGGHIESNGHGQYRLAMPVYKARIRSPIISNKATLFELGSISAMAECDTIASAFEDLATEIQSAGSGCLDTFPRQISGVLLGLVGCGAARA